MTEEEVILWSHIKDKQLGFKFRRQYSIGNYIADFYCPEKRLAIELDGSQHLDQQEYNKTRQDYMYTLGIKTLRFWNGDVRKNLSAVLMEIEKTLTEE